MAYSHVASLGEVGEPMVSLRLRDEEPGLVIAIHVTPDVYLSVTPDEWHRIAVAVERVLDEGPIVLDEGTIVGEPVEALGLELAGPLDHAWLVERYRARRRTPEDSYRRGYEEGRIAEYCSQNAITDEQAAAADELSLRLADAGGAS